MRDPTSQKPPKGSEFIPFRFADPLRPNGKYDNFVEGTLAGHSELAPYRHHCHQLANMLSAHYLRSYEYDLNSKLIASTATLHLRDPSKWTEDRIDRLNKAQHKAVLTPLVGALESGILAYKGVHIADEVFGSVLWKPKHSYIVAYFVKESGAKEMWYGQAIIYLRHMYAGKQHIFVLAQWFERVEPKFVNSRGRRLPEEHPMRAFMNAHIYEQFPLLKATPNPVDVGDLVPIQRIVCRWFPGKLSTSARPGVQQAIIVPRRR
jgi:hypothetical protein